VLCLHGGPGCASDYILPLTDLTGHGYEVVLYDQRGCGKSEPIHDKRCLTISQHVEEVEGVRKALNLGTIHLFGNSWGGMLALEYMFRYQENVKSLILSGALSSIPVYVKELEESKSKLSPNAVQTIRKYEAIKAFKNPTYLKSAMVWYRKHICRLPVWPPEVNYAAEQSEGIVFQTMWGPSELVCNGTLKTWDARDKLGKISVPCLITNGKYDNVTPEIGESIHRAIPKSKFVVMRNSGHMTMWDERTPYTRLISKFLKEING